ncbi:hypothetical protein, partial [Stenotrophomonas maltophilia]|uniref:hypothetical protein n=1 Tax=Stenotrophomonas maltophilia TaxID=40324 RepID=UPI00313D4906
MHRQSHKHESRKIGAPAVAPQQQKAALKKEHQAPTKEKAPPPKAGQNNNPEFTTHKAVQK